ncbi:MAG: RNA polymerase-binding protein DksA [Pseudomonadota bacterium]|nr:RNA polymerase-binding protein DksA [Pseudomonadota bacterium]|tara:strand:- start:236 stop:871 length:636 start_codon:yes stop_codon:yes gene_type:complete
MPKKAKNNKTKAVSRSKTAKRTKKTIVKKATQKKKTTNKASPKKTIIKKLVKKKLTTKKSTPKKKTPKKLALKKKRTGPVSSYKGRKGEKYMSAAMKKHFNIVLLEWRQHLKEEMQKTFDHLKNKGESYADPIDRASQEEEFAFELRTRDRERKLINKIASSIEQIKQNDYGYCHDCGCEIGVKRLEARPTATHCIDCKTLDEIKEKQLGG